MRIVVPVDSRLSDTAGLLFIDLFRHVLHVVFVETTGRCRRNGFRGGCLVGPYLFVCTSSQVMKLEIEWPQDGQPQVRTVQTIRRPEWMLGGRANADLHHVYFDGASDVLLVANSFMDCIDVLDTSGRLIDRRYLWDISAEIRDFAFERVEGAADLCHVNNICLVGDEIVLTLGNLNGSRQGALLSLGSGRILERGLAFPHDGLLTHEGFWLTEAGSQCATLFPEVRASCDLEKHNCERIDLSAVEGSDKRRCGKNWVRGLQFSKHYIFLGCSQFDEMNANDVEPEPSHIAVLDRRSRCLLGRICLPSNDLLKSPVIYSILIYDEHPRSTENDFSTWSSEATILVSGTMCG